jgi:hypothetical protein
MRSPAIPLTRRCALGAAVGAFAFCITIAMQERVLTSQDLFLHISIGNWILAHHSIPDYGIFSASMPNAPWVAHEWLSGVGFALLYDYLGWGGVVAGTGLLLALAVGVLTAEMSRVVGPLGALCASLLAWIVSVNHVAARPHVATLLLMVIWIAAHVRARHDDRTPPLYLLPVMTLWANVHGAFLLGLIFTALFGAEALYESETLAQARANALRWSVFFGASVLAATMTPHGIAGLLFPLKMTAKMAPVLDMIGEWMPSSLANNASLIFWLLLLLFIVLLNGIRLPICRLLMIMLLLYMALAHRRHTELLGFAAPLLLQYAIIDNLTPAARVFAWNAGLLTRPRADIALIAVSLLMMSLVVFLDARNVVHGQDRFTPAAAVDAVLAQGVSGQVMNEQIFGGYLIFRGIAPLIDGRVDMYGPDFVLRYAALDQLTGILDQYHIAWTIFLPASPSVTVLDNLPGWSRLYSDPYAVVHVRQEGAMDR